MSEQEKPGPMRLRLPATSANLGPGFDAVAVALDFFLEIEAEPAREFSITATGRDADRCARLQDNLILETYEQLLENNGRPVVPLALRMVNAIPLGMGCGSSAAARLAAIALAVHFGRLAWDTDRILEAAYELEGHPDNVAACWLGGFVAAVCEGTKVRVARVDPPAEWRALVALPAEPLSTSKARAVLPASFPLNDVVSNLQSTAVLALAFAQGRGELLRLAMMDRIHQPHRAPICPLLSVLEPMVGTNGILGVALSGAGPAVLIILDRERSLDSAVRAVQKRGESYLPVQVITCRFSRIGSSKPLKNKQFSSDETVIRSKPVRYQ